MMSNKKIQHAFMFGHTKTIGIWLEELRQMELRDPWVFAKAEIVNPVVKRIDAARDASAEAMTRAWATYFELRWGGNRAAARVGFAADATWRKICAAPSVKTRRLSRQKIGALFCA